MKYTADILKGSGVRFDERTHTYTAPDGTKYNGVTGILKAVLFPDKYAEVEQNVLDRAAARGTMIHRECQLDDFPNAFYIPNESSEELQGYRRIKAMHGIKMIATEYLLADHQHGVASAIDCIDEYLNLYDIKTTYSLDKEYISWQLSFYAMMFELQNPGLKAGNLYAIWLRRDTAELVQVERKTPEQVEGVLRAWQSGDVISNTAVKVLEGESQEMAQLIHYEEAIIALKEGIKHYEDKKQAILDTLKARMEAEGLKKIETDRVVVTVVAPGKRTTIDSTRLKRERPELWQEYSKETPRKGYLKITLRK